MFKWSNFIVKLVMLPKMFWILSILLVLSACFDVLTTVTGKMQFEANPIFLLGLGIVVMLFIKAFFTFWIIYLLGKSYFNSKAYKSFHIYMLITVIVMLIALQIFAGVNNVLVSESIPDDTPSPVSVDEKLGQLQSYLAFMLVFYAFPLCISLVSFACFRSFLKKDKMRLLE